jgi:alpha-ketoglutarate-dependent taurine dioxygenase
MSQPGTVTDHVTRVGWLPEKLTVEWSNGRLGEFASLWLRDNLPQDRDLHSGQRLVDIADLPAAPRICAAAFVNGTVQVEWQDDPRKGVFDAGWLQGYAADSARTELGSAHRRWLGTALDAKRDFAWAEFLEFGQNSHARVAWLGRLLQDGIAFLSNVPRTESGILEAASLFGRVCETNYGLVFDVRSVVSPENLAYSDLGLGLHTDNPYREPVPGFQALHVLVASPDGGENLFADGFTIAEHLRSTDPDAFGLLTRTPIPFAYRSKDAELYAERPFIQLSCEGAVSAVHYNNRSIAPLRLTMGQAPEFYAAYRKFAALLRDPRFPMKLRLRDGDLAVFDNQRTLHGRTAFSSAQYPRHLRGCYLTRDSVHSQAALLRRGIHSEAMS